MIPEKLGNKRDAGRDFGGILYINPPESRPLRH